MEKSMLESPVLGQIHPAVIFVFPPLVAQLTNGFAGEGRGWQGRNPKPFVIRGVYLALALAEAIPLQDFLGADRKVRKYPGITLANCGEELLAGFGGRSAFDVHP